MKIGLFGFGKTGKAVASVLLQQESVVLEWIVRQSGSSKRKSANDLLDLQATDPAIIYTLDEFQNKELLKQKPVDVLIDFSGQDGILHYGEQAATNRVAVVSAISHYGAKQMNFIKKLAKNIAVLWSPNITIGINFMIIASRILKQIAPETDIEIIEEHFKKKPELSGTARKLAEALDIPDSQIKMIRAGGIIGKHEALFGFPSQTLRLTHESISREAFGNGALFAANNIRNAAPGLYTMEDLLKPYFSMS